MDAENFHESDDRLELYALRRMAASEIEDIEEHLLICDSCRDRLEEIGTFALSMREALKTRPPAANRLAEWFGWLKPQVAMAGAFAAVLLAVGVYWKTAAVQLMPVASLQLTAMRGSEIQTVSQSRVTDLAFTDAAAASRADIVDASGSSVWSGALAQHGALADVRAEKVLSPGEYYVHVFAGSGQMLHEYRFRVSPARK